MKSINIGTGYASPLQTRQINNNIENQKNISTNLRRAGSAGNIKASNFGNQKKPINSIPLRSNTRRLSISSSTSAAKKDNINFRSCSNASTEQFVFLCINRKFFVLF